MSPYNVAMDIVAEALEKLAGTMEPLDLPLPLIGPGYYLEIMVKSPKSPSGPLQQGPPPPPFGQINGINIEGGQAPPVTQIEIILPGESVAQETIKLPSGGLAEITLVETDDAQNTAGSISAPKPIHEPGAETNVQPAENPLESADSQEAVSASTTFDSASAVTSTDSIIGEVVSDSFFAGQPTGLMSMGTSDVSQLTDVPTVSGSQLAQPLSPDAMGPMSTVSGIDFAGSKPTSTAGFSSAVDMTGMSNSQLTSRPDKSTTPATNTLATTAEETDTMGGMFGGLYSDQSASHTQGSSAESEAEVEAGIGLDGSIGGTVPSKTLTDNDSMLFGLPSSAPILSDSSNVISEIDQASSDFDQEQESSKDTSKVSTPNIGEDAIASEAMNTSGMTMESMPLPFPPFGDPQQQQQGLPTAQSTQNSSDLIAETATTSLGSNGGVVETIDIVEASDRYVLESSIDAILHSVMDEYETESIPKAAVGFALIHPRNRKTSLL
ncbi:hypothetical protein EV175_004017 [Coemansia sp. RSA 1933]|nr:hypothetical protein EV175_004017 [Coemansia sp. RSA 1933]